jgi:hypothetical protein
LYAFDVFSQCKNNIAYFKHLAKALEHPDAPGIVMKYLLDCDLSDFNPQEIPATKMKVETMREQLSNSIQFIINHITSWPENNIAKLACKILYQDYIT